MVNRKLGKHKEHKAVALRNKDSLLQLLVHTRASQSKGQGYFLNLGF